MKTKGKVSLIDISSGLFVKDMIAFGQFTKKGTKGIIKEVNDHKKTVNFDVYNDNWEYEDNVTRKMEEIKKSFQKKKIFLTNPETGDKLGNLSPTATKLLTNLTYKEGKEIDCVIYKKTEKSTPFTLLKCPCCELEF